MLLRTPERLISAELNTKRRAELADNLCELRARAAQLLTPSNNKTYSLITFERKKMRNKDLTSVHIERLSKGAELAELALQKGQRGQEDWKCEKCYKHKERRAARAGQGRHPTTESETKDANVIK